MSDPKRRISPHFEEFAVRVMYFMTTIDSFVPMAGLASWLAVTLLFGGTWTWWAAFSFGLTLACFTVANYYPTFVFGLPVFVATLLLQGGVGGGQAAASCGLCLMLGALTQMVFQGTPHLVASRDRTVIW